MMNTILTREFTSTDRNPNCNGQQRVLTVMSDGVMVRMTIQGVQGHGLNTRLVTISDATVPMDAWTANKELILSAAQ